MSHLPTISQEAVLIEDLLYAMVSVEGQFLKRKETDISQYSTISTGFIWHFSSNDNEDWSKIDQSLISLCYKILPICGKYDTICTFMNQQ